MKHKRMYYLSMSKLSTIYSLAQDPDVSIDDKLNYKDKLLNMDYTEEEARAYVSSILLYKRKPEHDDIATAVGRFFLSFISKTIYVYEVDTAELDLKEITDGDTRWEKWLNGEEEVVPETDGERSANKQAEWNARARARDIKIKSFATRMLSKVGFVFLNKDISADVDRVRAVLDAPIKANLVDTIII